MAKSRKREKEQGDLDIEVLLRVHEVQMQLEGGTWDPAWTVYNRVGYLVAKAHDAVTPSPVPGKQNMERAFRTRFERAVRRLAQRGFVRFRKTHGPNEKPPAHKLGYARHAERGRDLALTDLGRQTAEALARSASGPQETLAVDRGGARLIYEPVADRSGGGHDYVLSIRKPGPGSDE